MRLLKLTTGTALFFLGASCLGSSAKAQDSAKPTVEPVYRLSHNVDVNAPSNGAESQPSNDTSAAAIAKTRAPHPLDRALNIAETGLVNIQSNIRDYKAIMVKRERISGQLQDPEFMSVKIRNAHQSPQGEVPFSIYMRFLKPKSVKGREVIWVDGKNDNKIIAHDGGALRRLITVRLDPTGSFAMTGNRYPIYEAGIENLVSKLIEKGTRDREAGPCEVKYIEQTKINKRPCTMIQVVHHEKKAPYEFHKAQIFIDNELQIPVRYAAYLWPTKPGAKPPLLEEYTYVNVELNVGLTDRDFDHTNSEYDFN